jgi:hypothetical protein
MGSWQPFMQTYPEVPFITAELILMMNSNVSNADVYDLSSVYNGSLYSLAGAPRALDLLYTQILPHYDSQRLVTNLTGTVGGVFGSASESLQNHSLTVLAVNTNTTQSVDLRFAGKIFPSDGSYSVWRSNNSTTSPDGTYQSSSGIGSISNWVLPPLGVLLVSVCLPQTGSAGSGSYEVTFCESGLPPGTRWSVTLAGHTVSGPNSTISFSKSDGTYAYRVRSVKGWNDSVLNGTLLVKGDPDSIVVSWTQPPAPRLIPEHGSTVGVLEPTVPIAYTAGWATVRGLPDPVGSKRRAGAALEFENRPRDHS